MKRTRINSYSKTSRARLKHELDSLCAQIIMAVFSNQCAICRSTTALHPAHIVSKASNPWLRFDILNLLPLCSAHHGDLDYRNGQEAHERIWRTVKAQFPKHYAYTVENRHKKGARRSDDELRSIRDTLKKTLEQLGG